MAGFTPHPAQRTVVRMPSFRPILMAACLAASGCAPSREYELVGQVLAVDPARQEITVRHEDIRGFMPGMTMPFKVKEGQLLDGRMPGDLIKATLVVKDSQGYLSAISTTGHTALTEPVPPRAPLDVLEPGDLVADVQLTDARGKPHGLTDWRGRLLVVTFTYTRCPLPDFCPRMDRHLAAVQRDVLADSSLRERIRLLSVSVDPKHDTPQVLSVHARKVAADPAVWRFATGEPDAIGKFVSQFGVSVIRDGANGNDIVHNMRTAVIGVDGRLLKVFNGTDWKPEEFMRTLREMVKGEA